MDIFEFAKKMELDGEGYYRELADKVGNPGLKHILNMLADDEVKHYNILNDISKTEYTEMADSPVLERAKNIFEKMKGRPFDKNIGESALYKKAQELERQSLEFYEKKASEEELKNQKDLLLRIAEEEKKHFFLLENIINFVTRPENWIEDAEFNHLEDY